MVNFPPYTKDCFLGRWSENSADMIFNEMGKLFLAGQLFTKYSLWTGLTHHITSNICGELTKMSKGLY